MLMARTTRAMSLCLGSLAIGCVLATGCVLESDEDVGVADMPLVNKGTNNLDPAAKSKFAPLYSAMSGPLLAAPAENQVVTTQVASLMLTDALGRATMDHVTQLVRASGQTLTSPFGGGWTALTPGHGILTPAQAWASGGINDAAKLQVISGVAALINPSQVTVPVYFKGSMIGGGAVFPMPKLDEALFITKQISPGLFVVNVFPMNEFIQACGSQTNASLNTRLCGTPAGCTAVQIRNDLSAACTMDANGYYACDGIAAIQTVLDPDLIGTHEMHRNCVF
jgi:hypothetical protein